MNHYFEGQPVRDAHIRVCVLFDPKDGRVVHGHGVTVLGSEQPMEPADVEARAREGATKLGLSVDGLKALHVPIEDIRRHRAFKVNDTGDGVVALPDPPGHRNRA